MKITQKIKSLEDAYKALGLNQQDELPFQNPKNSRQVAANSFVNATVLVEALNEGRKPDYDNYNEDKYTIWWDMRSEAAGGPGFSYYVYRYGYTYSCVGARLVFFDRAVAKYAGTHFAEVFKSFMTFQEFTEVPKG